MAVEAKRGVGILTVAHAFVPLLALRDPTMSAADIWKSELRYPNHMAAAIGYFIVEVLGGIVGMIVLASSGLIPPPLVAEGLSWILLFGGWGSLIELIHHGHADEGPAEFVDLGKDLLVLLPPTLALLLAWVWLP